MDRARIRFVGFDDTSIGSPYAEDPDSEEYREELAYAVDSFNRVVEGIDGIHTSLHLYGKLRSEVLAAEMLRAEVGG